MGDLGFESLWGIFHFGLGVFELVGEISVGQGARIYLLDKFSPGSFGTFL